MTDEELIERMAQELCIADWGVLRPEHIGPHYLGLARAILPLIREAELRGVKAGIEAAIIAALMAPARGIETARAIGAIDPATVVIAPTPNP